MLKTNICGIRLNNPTILASGIIGVTGSSLINAAEKGAGAVTTKSISVNERKGHAAPVILTTNNFTINAVGLSNAGIDESLSEIEFAVKNSKSPVIASIFANKISDFGVLAEKISTVKPGLIEVNISCPNVESEFGKPFSIDPIGAARVTRMVKENTRIPVIIKLSPNVQDIRVIAKAVEEAGADAICAINTVGPGMCIDIRAKMPILSNKSGGLGGPAIKPIAIKAVYDIYESVKIPIIGTGGVLTGEDAVEMMMAGASAVGIGSGVYYRGVEVFSKVTQEMKEFMNKEGYSKLKDVTGVAHNVH